MSIPNALRKCDWCLRDYPDDEVRAAIQSSRMRLCRGCLYCYCHGAQRIEREAGSKYDKFVEALFQPLPRHAYKTAASSP